MLDRASSDAAIWSAVSDPEILIGTFSYLLLKPLLRNSGLVEGYHYFDWVVEEVERERDF